jgi:two-component system chemotaxis response regulator CheB
MWEIRDENVVQYRCREGHSYTAKALLAGQKSWIEESLWAAVQTMDERGPVLPRLI